MTWASPCDWLRKGGEIADTGKVGKYEISELEDFEEKGGCVGQEVDANVPNLLTRSCAVRFSDVGGC